MFGFIRRLFMRGKRDSNTNNDKSQKDINNEKENSDPLDPLDPLDIMVERYLQNNYINIPLIPNHLERYLYRIILSSIFDIFKKEEESLKISFMGYNIGYKLSTMIIPSLCKTHKVSKPPKEKFQYIEKIVETFVESNQVNIRFVPNWAEKNLYKNVLILLYGILEDTLHHMHIHLIGHDIRLQITHSKNTITDRKDIVKLDNHEKIIEEIVETIMEKHNVFLIPDFIERGFYKMSLRISLFFYAHLSMTLE